MSNVISKSGGLKKNCNGLEAKAKFKLTGLELGKHSPAIGKTAEGIAHAIGSEPEDMFRMQRHLPSKDSRVQVIAGGEPVNDEFLLAT